MKQQPVQAPKTIKVKNPIVLKLIGIISAIVLVSTVMVTIISTWRFSEDSRARAEKNNFDMNELQAIQVENHLQLVHRSVILLFDILATIQGNRTMENATVTNYWLRNASVASIILPGVKNLHNSRFYRSSELEPTLTNSFLEIYKTELEQSQGGMTILLNAAPVYGFPMACLMMPYRDFGSNNALVIFFSMEELQARLLGSSLYESFLVNNRGDLLLSRDIESLLVAQSMEDHPVVGEMLQSPLDNKQIQFTDAKGERYFGAFRKLGGQEGGLITYLPEQEIVRVIQDLVLGNVFLSLVILVISIAFVYFFSKTLSKPIRNLTRATLAIEAGNFHPEIKATSSDEVGLLTQRFIEMSKGLEERERIKDTFGKFVNKEVAEQALRGNLTLGGVKKEATIFFSDIRSFTAISETLLPEQVVEFLNQYMTRMVHCVTTNHGAVDKFIGDAIMALWGVPVSQGSVKADALNAIRATLQMRKSLKEFNQDRGSPEKPYIKIGCGLNTGYAIAGQIGSEERMEYTVIGDAVNLASRIEALNKPLGTDILISENTFRLLEDQLLVAPMPAIKVKGKKDPLNIYAVINIIGEPGPQTLQEVRDFVGIIHEQGTPELGEEEVKYEILP